jgi:hypothetical protein
MRNRFRFKGRYICSKDCEVCEGQGYVVSGLEGFINRNMEQDCRDTYEACENAVFDDPDWDSMAEAAKERRMEKEEA